MGTSAHRKGMQRSPFASCGTSFHLFPVLLMRYNCLHLILYSRKLLRSLCRWGHLHTRISTHRKGMQRSPFASCGTSYHLFPVLLMRYNYLHLILYSRKLLRSLCRCGHLHTPASAHHYNYTPINLQPKKTRHRKLGLFLLVLLNKEFISIILLYAGRSVFQLS